MNTPPENEFQDLRRLLALKRHEQPPPGYFNNLHRDIIAQLKAERAPQTRRNESPDASAQIEQYESLVGKILREDAPLLSEHPVFGPISPDQWRTFHCWHAAHHLSFLIPKVTQLETRDSVQSRPAPQQTLEA